jgi:hypothetical protein
MATQLYVDTYTVGQRDLPRLNAVIANAVALYASIGIAIVSAPPVVLANAAKRLTSPEIGKCSSEEALSTDQITLFEHHPAGSQRVGIFVVRTSRLARAGCSRHPTDKATGIITEVKQTHWTVAHELGHLLGLDHSDGHNDLMQSHTSRLGDPPQLPVLSVDQVATIRGSPLLTPE